MSKLVRDGSAAGTVLTGTLAHSPVGQPTKTVQEFRRIGHQHPPEAAGPCQRETAAQSTRDRRGGEEGFLPMAGRIQRGHQREVGPGAGVSAPITGARSERVSRATRAGSRAKGGGAPGQARVEFTTVASLDLDSVQGPIAAPLVLGLGGSRSGNAAAVITGTTGKSAVLLGSGGGGARSWPRTLARSGAPAHQGRQNVRGVFHENRSGLREPSQRKPVRESIPGEGQWDSVQEPASVRSALGLGGSGPDSPGGGVRTGRPSVVALGPGGPSRPPQSRPGF